MLYINKRPAPDTLLRQVSSITKSDEWKNSDENDTKLQRTFFDSLDKQVIREALVREQHGLCAYCMKRIEVNDKMNIEHFLPVKGHKDRVLDYGNMLGCCKGGSDTQDANKILCCDAAKKESEISINPQNKNMMGKIRYNKKGRIYVYPEDANLQRDIDYILMLNGKLDENGNMMYDTPTKIVEGRRGRYRNFEILMKGLQKNMVKMKLK